MTALLDGVLVLDLSSVGPATRASRWLADYGADVVKVAPVPSQSGLQTVPPPHAYSGGRGTRRVCIDLKSSAGRDVFLRLATNADVVIESFRPGVVQRLGIGYDDVREVNPRIVYCATSGYGQTGPRSQWAGHDLNYLAVSGYLAMTERTNDDKPPLPGTTIADSTGGGLHAVTAILAALLARSTSGEGAYLDVAVVDGMLSVMALQVDDYLATGRDPAPATSPLGGRFACYDVYAAADGRWLSVAAIEGKFWANLCRALGLERWCDRQYDDAAQDEIRADLAAVLRTRPRDEWVQRLADADTCVAPVLTVAEAADDDDLARRGTVVTARHPRTGDIRQLAPTLAGAARATHYQLPDGAQSDIDAVLGAHGFSDTERASLREMGAVA
jgi:alpha-methylacyl-CoA racemase